MTWRKRVAAFAIVGAVTVLIAGIAVTAVEFYLRARLAQSLYAEARRRPPHPFLQVLASGQVPTNAAGFRGDPVTEKKAPGTYRIFTLGGSTTLGVANPYEESYPARLQALLRQRYPDIVIEVQNAGVAWYSTAHILVNYELRVRRYDPDLVIVFEAINDLYRGFSAPWWTSGPFKPDYSHFLGPYARFLGPDLDTVTAVQRPLGSEWLLWRNLKRRFGMDPTPYDQHAPNVASVTARLQPRPVTEFRSLPSFKAYYERLVRNILADGHRLVVASQPFLYASGLPDAERGLLYYPQIFCAEDGYYPAIDSMVSGMRQYNATARAVASAAGVPFLDFEAAVPKKAEYFSDDVHLTAAGNDILARRAFEWIVAEGLLESRRPRRP